MVDAEQMRAIYAAATTVGWREALLRASVEYASLNLREIFASESRGSWRILLPPSARGRALVCQGQIGCLGLALARWCEEVVVLHPDENFLGFLKLQAKGLGFDNIRPVPGDVHGRLPFVDHEFDAVILDSAGARGSHPRPFRGLVQEARRVLRPEGCLYLGADNRFGATRDRASGSRSHGYFGYRRLLRRAGYESVRFCEPLQRPVGPRDDNWYRQMKRRIRGHRWFAPTFDILAAPRRLGRSWASHFAEHVAGELGATPASAPVRFRKTGAHTAGLIMTLGDACVVRVSFEPADQARVRRNFEGLGAARDLVRSVVGVRTPEPLLEGDYEAVPFTVESHLDGRTLDRLSMKGRPAAEERMFELLQALQRLTTPGESAGGDTDWQQRVVRPLRHAADWCENDEQRRIATELVARAEEIDGALLPTAFSHGDFKWANMLVSSTDPAIALIDWDRWSARDFVSTDFLHFVCNHRRLRTGCDWPEAFRTWLAGANQDEQELRWTRRFLEQHDLSPGWESAACLAYWAATVASSAGTRFDLDRPWIRKTYLSLLPAIHARVGGRT